MKIEDIKKQMIEYRDFFDGQMDVDKIRAATSIEDLREVFDIHYEFISSMANDAQHSLERFKQKIGVSEYHLKKRKK